MRSCLYILVFLLLGGSIFAQGGRHCSHALFGVITDSSTFEPLPYAHVSIPGTEKGVLTNMEGEYRIEDVCDGDLTIRVSHVGCETKDYTVTIKENTHFDIQLPHSESHTDTVHIHDKHPGPKPTQASSKLGEDDLDKQSGKTIGEMLENITGMTALKTGANIFKPMIHGLHSNRVLIMNNGVRLESQQWGSEHGPEIDPFVAEEIHVVKGADGVRYGPDAMGGVVLVEPAALRDSAGYDAKINLAGNSNGWMGASSAIVNVNPGGKLASLGMRIQGTLKRGGNVRSPEYFIANSGMREYNFSAAAAWTKTRYGIEAFYSQFNTDIGIFSGAHIGNLTDLQRAIESDTPFVSADFTYDIARPRQHIEHETTKWKAFYQTSEKTKLSLTYARQYNLRQEYDAHEIDDDIAELNYRITTHSGELMWEHEKIRGMKGKIGLTGQTQANTWSGIFFIPNYRNYTGGAFLIERYVGLRWELEAGLRYDYKWLRTYEFQNDSTITNTFNWSRMSATVGGLVRISPHVRLHANLGTAWRPPAVNELFSNGLHHGAAAVEIGNKNLQAEQIYNASMTLNYEAHEKAGAEVSLYHNFIKDFIYLQPVQPPTLTIRGAFPTFEYRQADANMTGMDASVFWNFAPGLTWQSTASILRARANTPEKFLVGIPADRFSHSIKYTFHAGESIRNPYLTLKLRHVRRQNRVADSTDYSPPPDAYVLLDFEAGTTLQFGKQELNVHFGAYNILNTSYREYLDRFRYFTDAMGRNFAIRLNIPINR